MPTPLVGWSPAGPVGDDEDVTKRVPDHIRLIALSMHPGAADEGDDVTEIQTAADAFAAILEAGSASARDTKVDLELEDIVSAFASLEKLDESGPRPRAETARLLPRSGIVPCLVAPPGASNDTRSVASEVIPRPPPVPSGAAFDAHRPPAVERAPDSARVVRVNATADDAAPVTTTAEAEAEATMAADDAVKAPASARLAKCRTAASAFLATAVLFVLVAIGTRTPAATPRVGHVDVVLRGRLVTTIHGRAPVAKTAQAPVAPAVTPVAAAAARVSTPAAPRNAGRAAHVATAPRATRLVRVAPF